MDVKEQILQFINQKGPVLPVHIAKEIKSDILMASAHLSELSSNKKVRVSNVKVGGGSPLYYLPGQESKLQDFSSNLHEKEQKAYTLLSQKKILKDSDLEPVIRAALRQIKDFAVPLQVNYKGSMEIFWKWFLLSSEEAESMIKSLIKTPEKAIKKPEEISEQSSSEHLRNSKSISKSLSDKSDKKIVEKPKEEIKPKLPETQQELKKPEIEKTQEKTIKQPETITKQAKPTGNFFKQITDYFEKNKIDVIEQNIIRKSSEIDFTIKVPSSVGALTYYCKAKNKKRINDGDLSSAYIQSQSKKMPVLLLMTGELTKKAKEMFEKEFKGMNIKQI